MVSNENQCFYIFKDFRLDTSERQLLRGQEAIPLTPKVFDVLTVLVRHGGRLVEKNELLHKVWEDSFVEEANIARVIHTLRKTLGENSENKFIETVAKRGYRFVAEVEKVSGLPLEKISPSPVAPELCLNYVLENTNHSVIAEKLNNIDSAPAKIKLDDKLKNVRNVVAEKRGLEKRSWINQAAGALLILLILVAGSMLTKALWVVSGEKENKSIAILPLKPINSASRETIYELGIAESIILRLNSINTLTVRPLSSTRKYLELENNSTDIGQEQQVDYVLSSNYQIADGKIRVTSLLTNIRNGLVEETFKSEKDLASIFATQDAIANDIGNVLAVKFGNQSSSQAANLGTTNEEAYRLYLQGKFILDQVDYENFSKAVDFFEQATKLDPNYAQAYVGLAYAYRTVTSKGVGKPSEAYLKSKEASEKALALNPNLADAHAVSGLIKNVHEWKFAEAEIAYKRALNLNPNSSQVRAMYASYLVSPRRFDEAVSEIQKAIEIEPASFSHQINYGIILYHAHRYDESLAQFRKVLEKDPNVVKAYFFTWLLYDLKGEEAQAYEWFIKYQTQIKVSPETIEIYRNAYQKGGWKELLREHIVQDEKNITPASSAGLYFEMACFNARLGNADQAFAYLNKSFENHSYGLATLQADPFLDSLHEDPRFKELVQKIGFNN